MLSATVCERPANETTADGSPSAPLPERVAPSHEREHGLDWLRVIAFALLILYHSGMAYVSWSWVIKDVQRSPALEAGMLFLNRWRLPLLFLISGAGVSFSLRRRTLAQFAGERLRRLLVPLVFAMFVVVPPQIYFELLYRGAHLSYREFYPSVFQLRFYPDGSLSWHHLWFVLYILVYSLAGIPLFAALRSGPGRRCLAALVRGLERRPSLLYLLNVPMIAVGLVLEPRWPTTLNLVSDWANLVFGLIYFLLGFVIASERGLLELVTRRRVEMLLVGLTCAAAWFGAIATGVTLGWPPVAAAVLRASLGGNVVPTGFLTMGVVLALVGFARAHLSRGGRRLSYATETVYPFYIVHQTITVAAVYALLSRPWGAWPKFALVAAATFGGSWLCVELVRRVPPLRPLFGLKTQARPRSTRTAAG